MSNKVKTTAMKNEPTPALTPKLRFPEFRDAAGWAVKPLDELFTIGNGRDYKHLGAGDVPVYGSGGYMLSVNDFLYEGESVCIGRKGTINNPMFLSGRFWTVDTLFFTHSFKECLPKFIFAIFQQIDWLKHNEAGGVPSLSKTNIQKIKTAAPSVAEQQKIADCLSSVDELIAAQARKVDALKTHKKGLMQQLFPREGETQPRLRFPEFQAAGEWEPSQLIALSSVGLSNGVFNDPKKVGTGYKLINVSDMYIDTTIDEGRLSFLELSLSDFKANQVIHGDIFFTRSSLVKSGIAVSNIYLGNSGDVTFDGHLIRFRANTSKVIPLFAHYLFKTAPIREQLIARGKSATMTTIGQSDVASVMLFYPDKDEQQRIASCLTSLDDLITAQAQKLAALKTHKQGLMQQLFPASEDQHRE